MRAEASSGRYAITAAAPAAQLTATVKVKSTRRAPSGTNAQPSPNAAAIPLGQGDGQRERQSRFAIDLVARDHV